MRQFTAGSATRPTGGFLAAAFGAQPALLILTGIMGAVAAAATLARGMRLLSATRTPR